MKEKELIDIQLSIHLPYMMIGVSAFFGHINSLHTYFLNRWASTLSNRKERAMIVGSG